MTKNPLINATLSLAYIMLVVTLMNFVTRVMGNKPDTIFAPVAALSLFTLSAAIMAYLFLYQPVQLYVDGKKKEGTRLFVQTIASFALLTILVFILLFSGVFPYQS